MGFIADIVAQGYGGYRGWKNDAAAEADFRATGGAGKWDPGAAGEALGYGVSGSTSSKTPFNFDYPTETTKAYGELNDYYTRLLTESKGDMNKVLSRLVEDYDRGLRFKTEDLAVAKDANQYQQGLAERSAVNNALSRGIYNKSQYAPGQYGIADTMLTEAKTPYEKARTALDTGFSRYKETAGVDLARQQTDLPEEERRKEFALEQERRQRAAEIANLRGQQSYQKYSSTLV